MRAYLLLGLWTGLIVYVAVMQGAIRPVDQYFSPSRRATVATPQASPTKGKVANARKARRGSDRGVDSRAYEGFGSSSRDHAQAAW